MLKIILCLMTCGIVATVLLQLRQQRLSLDFQNNRLHGEIEARQAELWDQQLQIAICTAPNAIQKTVGESDMKLVPPQPQDGRKRNWNESAAAE